MQMGGICPKEGKLYSSNPEIVKRVVNNAIVCSNIRANIR